MSEDKIVSLDWYDRNTQRYIDATLNADISHVRERFLRHVPVGGRILDAGCGPGRDALAFQSLGFDVTAIDASREMVRFASQLIGKPVQQLRHQDVAFSEEFDGVWSMASLLHVPLAEQPNVFERYRNALVAGGVFFASFKHGSGEAVVNSRFFAYHNEESITEMIESTEGFKLLDVWTDMDTRPERRAEKWVSVICRRE